MRDFAYIRLRFPIVFQPVNLSFCSIIRQFSTRVNSRKTSCFPGVHRLVNALKTDCFPLFYRHFLVTDQRFNWCLLEFSLIFLMSTAWFMHGIGCFPMFSGVFQLQNNAFTEVFSEFSCIFMNRKCVENARKPSVLQCSPVG